MKTKFIETEKLNQIFEDIIEGRRGDLLAAEYEKQVEAIDKALGLLDPHEDLFYVTMILELERDQLLKELHEPINFN